MKRVLIPVLALALLAVTMSWQSAMPETVLSDPPEVHLGDLAGWTTEWLEPSETEVSNLPKDTTFEKCLYTDAGGKVHLVTLVVGGRSKSSIHRPELCLPSQGFLMKGPHTRKVGKTSWRILTLDRGKGCASNGFAYTFFNQAGYRTSSHIRRIFRDVWDRSLHGRIDRWSMVTVFADSADESELVRFLSQFEEVLE